MDMILVSLQIFNLQISDVGMKFFLIHTSNLNITFAVCYVTHLKRNAVSITTDKENALQKKKGMNQALPPISEYI